MLPPPPLLLLPLLLLLPPLLLLAFDATAMFREPSRKCAASFPIACIDWSLAMWANDPCIKVEEEMARDSRELSLLRWRLFVSLKYKEKVCMNRIIKAMMRSYLARGLRVSQELNRWS